MKKTNKKGFTIVELVIVIAVIAILAAVLIPTFAGVVEKAKDSNRLQTARAAVTSALAEIGSTGVVPSTMTVTIQDGSDYYHYSFANSKLSTEYTKNTTAPAAATAKVADLADGVTVVIPTQTGVTTQIVYTNNFGS